MKKILFILFLIICIPFCLYIEKIEKINRRDAELLQQNIKKYINDTTDLQDDLYNVKFDGHLYVVYREYSGYGMGAAMVHSPNCECHKEKLNDEKIN